MSKITVGIVSDTKPYDMSSLAFVRCHTAQTELAVLDDSDVFKLLWPSGLFCRFTGSVEMFSNVNYPYTLSHGLVGVRWPPSRRRTRGPKYEFLCHWVVLRGQASAGLWASLGVWAPLQPSYFPVISRILHIWEDERCAGPSMDRDRQPRGVRRGHLKHECLRWTSPEF